LAISPHIAIVTYTSVRLNVKMSCDRRPVTTVPRFLLKSEMGFFRSNRVFCRIDLPYWNLQMTMNSLRLSLYYFRKSSGVWSDPLRKHIYIYTNRFKNLGQKNVFINTIKRTPCMAYVCTTYVPILSVNIMRFRHSYTTAGPEGWFGGVLGVWVVC